MGTDSMHAAGRPWDREEGHHDVYEIYGAAVEALIDHDFAFPGSYPISHLAEAYAPVKAPLVLVSCRPFGDTWEEESISPESELSEHAKVRAIPAPSTESDHGSPPAPWIEKVATRFAELLTLPTDWDGHGGGSVAARNVEAAGRFLARVMAASTPAPAIVPTSSGGLQLEWHRGGFDVELLFGEEEPPLLYVAEAPSGREWEGPPVEGFAEFELAQRLIG